MRTEGRMLVIGFGRLGKTLVHSFGECGNGVARVAGVSTTHPDEVGRLFPELDLALYSEPGAVPVEDYETYDIIWLAVPDRVIGEVAAHVAAQRENWQGKVLLHASGATSIAPLAPFKERGGAVAVVHPNAILGGDTPFPQGLVWGITPGGFTLDQTERLLAPFSPTLIEISDESRPLYHAAASVAANYSMVLFAAAVRLYRAAGVPPELAGEIVARFMEEGIRVSLSQGIQRGLTGPVARGDTATIDRHLAAIRSRAPDLYALVVELVRAAEQMLKGEDGGVGSLE